MFDSIARRLQFDREARQRIRFLIYHHLRANAYQGSWTDSAVRRFDLEMGRYLDELVELSLADVTSRRPGRRQEAAQNIEALVRRIHAVRELDAKVPPLPAGLGNAFMEAFAMPAGRRIGELRKMCEDAIEKGELEERRDADYYVDFLRSQGITSRASCWRPAGSGRRPSGPARPAGRAACRRRRGRPGGQRPASAVVVVGVLAAEGEAHPLPGHAVAHLVGGGQLAGPARRALATGPSSCSVLVSSTAASIGLPPASVVR